MTVTRTTHAGYWPDKSESDQAGESALPISFGDFIVSPAARMLSFKGQAIDLGGRAFDLLIVLLQARGAVLTKEEIMQRVWPSTIVEQSNLRVQMAILRRALGEASNLIKTVPGRGYMLVADQSREAPPRDRPPLPPAVEERAVNAGLRNLISSFPNQAVKGPFDLHLPASAAACEMLRTMLHTALDEMWDVLLNRDDLQRRAVA